MEPIDRFNAIEEIKQLKARYFRCVDTKDWEGLAMVFAPDIQFDIKGAGNVRNPWTGVWNPPLPEGENVCSGREEVIKMVRSAVEAFHTIHHGHMPEIEILDETSARGIWAMKDELRDSEHRLLLKGCGHYHETYVKLAAGWAIKTSKITRLSLFIAGLGQQPDLYL